MTRATIVAAQTGAHRGAALEIRDYYEQSYHFDDDAQYPDPKRLERALRLLEPLQGGSFLDIGSGVGHAVQTAGRRGATTAIGIDFAFRALALGKSLDSDTTLVQADGCLLPFADGSFDRILSFGSIEHFGDVPAALLEVRRILEPNGVAVIVVPNRLSNTEQPQELRLSYRQWNKLFAGAGLRLLSAAGDPGPPVFRDRRPARVALRAAAKLCAVVPPIAYQIIFRLTRPGD